MRVLDYLRCIVIVVWTWLALLALYVFLLASWLVDWERLECVTLLEGVWPCWRRCFTGGGPLSFNIPFQINSFCLVSNSKFSFKRVVLVLVSFHNNRIETITNINMDCETGTICYLDLSIRWVAFFTMFFFYHLVPCQEYQGRINYGQNSSKIE